MPGTFSGSRDRQPDRAGRLHRNAPAATRSRSARRPTRSATPSRRSPAHDGSSWLDSGFVEGELIQISGVAGHLQDRVVLLERRRQRQRAAADRTDRRGRVRPRPPSRSGRRSRPSRRANWYTPVNGHACSATRTSSSRASRQNMRVFATQPHNLSGIAGPLSVSGGASDVGDAIHPAVLLPGEGNGPTFGVAAQPPEWQQIDTLNVYDDGSLNGQTGTLTSTALTGLSMGADPDGSLRPAAPPRRTRQCRSASRASTPTGSATADHRRPARQLRHRQQRLDDRGPERPARPGQRPPDRRLDARARPRLQPGHPGARPCSGARRTDDDQRRRQPAARGRTARARDLQRHLDERRRHASRGSTASRGLRPASRSVTR